MTAFLYEVGMFGTCANPLHQGHVATIIRAASECRELYVVLSYSHRRGEVDYRVRHQWIAQTVSHLPHVRIIDLEDDAPSKEAYSETDWQQGAAQVRNIIGRPIDAIYCGSDYKADGTSPYQSYYPEARVVYTDRSLIPVSSSAIRQNPLMHWHYLAKAARPYYVRNVLIIGHESTGKSTLTQNLASLYNTEAVMEYGRDVCARCGGTEFMVREDYEEIISVHRSRINDARRRAERYLFIDTDAHTTYWYAQQSGVDIEKPALDSFELVLFLSADVPFVQDGLRSDENNTDSTRAFVSDALKQFYLDAGCRFCVVDGATHAERLAQAVQYIEERQEK